MALTFRVKTSATVGYPRWEGEAPAEPLPSVSTMLAQREFLALLKRHGIEYDPKYVWE